MSHNYNDITQTNTVVVDEATKIVQVIKRDYLVTISRDGFQGPPGPAGPTGPAGSGANNISELDDVVLIGQQNDDLLKFNSALGVWKNTTILDGGHF